MGFGVQRVGTLAWRAALGPVVLVLTAIALFALRMMSEPSIAAALRAEAYFEAARVGDLAAMRYAVEHDGLSIELRETGSGRTPLMCAVNGRQSKAVVWLLDRGADINASVPGYGTPLAIAASDREGSEMVAMLLARGADPNACARDGVTPLMQAAMWDNADSVAMLLHAGARPDARSVYGNTARSIAASNGYDQVVRLMDDAPAKPAIDRRGHVLASR
jgi:ankyrin repeat protein